MTVGSPLIILKADLGVGIGKAVENIGIANHIGYRKCREQSWSNDNRAPLAAALRLGLPQIKPMSR